MVDIVDTLTRSKMMAGIKHKNTKPEMLIRKAMHTRGYRFRLHVKNLAGKPDLVFPRYSAVLFIHGCFWHGHNCELFKLPKSNTDFWQNKISSNRVNDTSTILKLKSEGWRVGCVWECSLRGKARLEFDSIVDHISRWLKSSDPCLNIYGKSKIAV